LKDSKIKLNAFESEIKKNKNKKIKKKKKKKLDDGFTSHEL
jgi:hypothetical protein